MAVTEANSAPDQVGKEFSERTSASKSGAAHVQRTVHHRGLQANGFHLLLRVQGHIHMAQRRWKLLDTLHTILYLRCVVLPRVEVENGLHRPVLLPHCLLVGGVLLPRPVQ